MSRTGRDDGAAAVEFALVLPILLLLISAIIDFGRIYFEQSTLSGAAREGVRLVALGKTDGSAIAAAVDYAAGSVSGLNVTVRVGAVSTIVESGGVAVTGATIPACVPGAPVTVVASSGFTFWTPLPGLAHFTGLDTLAGKGVMRCGG